VTNGPDTFQLQRFVDAQKDVIDIAVAELRAGKKESHWMWFVFPQLAGLGNSPTAQFYAIRSIHEARAYLAHPILGERLRVAVDAILAWASTRTAAEILGEVDAMKLRSSLTLFEAASGDPLFALALDAFFDSPDEATLRLIGQL
jgi:uncharacterized protein (DUF1810 family)